MPIPKTTSPVPERCECHDGPLDGALSDGVLTGFCSVTGGAVIRINPRTGDAEWLDEASPQTERNDLRKA